MREGQDHGEVPSVGREKEIDVGLSLSSDLTCDQTCDQCKKTVKARVVKTPGRHGETLSFPGVYCVGIGNSTDDALEIKLGPNEYDLEGNNLGCSPKCAIKLAASLLPKLELSEEPLC